MRLTSVEARKLLEIERKTTNDYRWINHFKETYKLKEYFDNLLGYNLYDLFPEIKENL